jgi:hypothetical protein
LRVLSIPFPIIGRARLPVHPVNSILERRSRWIAHS